MRFLGIAVLGLAAMLGGLNPAGQQSVREPVQVIDDEHLMALVTQANSDYRDNLRNVACREEIEFTLLAASGNPKRQTQYEFDYSLPTNARRPVAVIELRVPVGHSAKVTKNKNFEPRESVRDLNWRDLLRIFEPTYRDDYVFGSTGQKMISGRKVWILEFRPVQSFDATFEPFLDGYRVRIPVGGQAFVDAQSFRITALEMKGLGLPASRKFPIAKRVDFLDYSVSVDFEPVQLEGKLRYLPKLIRSELGTSDGRIIEERRYHDFQMLGR